MNMCTQSQSLATGEGDKAVFTKGEDNNRYG